MSGTAITAAAAPEAAMKFRLDNSFLALDSLFSFRIYSQGELVSPYNIILQDTVLEKLSRNC
jgi:hypothetical protein